MQEKTQAAFVFLSPESSHFFAKPCVAQLGAALSPLDERRFADGEFTLRPGVPLEGRRVVLIHTLARDQQESLGDKLCALLFLSAAVRNAGATDIILVAPYLCLGRSDRPTEFQGPVLNRAVAELLEAAGVRCVLTMDAHNLSAYHNAWRCRALHVSAVETFVRYFQTRVPLENAAVVSPDLGGMKRCAAFRDRYCQETGRSLELCVASKHRVDHVIDDQIVQGSVQGKDAIILDDMISTGSTLAHAIHACETQGARRIFVAATHGLFAEGADTLLGPLPFERILLTNTVQPYALSSASLRERLEILDVSASLAAACKRLVDGDDRKILQRDF